MIQIPDFHVVLYETTGITELTRHIRKGSLEFGDVDPGGYGAINFDLDRDLEADNFEDAAIVVVTHAATGIEACAGRLMNPGRGIDPDGNEVWKMSTLGQGQHHLQEVNTPYHLIDTRIEEGTWWRGFRHSKRFEFANAAHPDDETIPGWLFTPEEGMNIAFATSSASINYYDIEQYGLAYDAKIGGFSGTRDMGRATSNQVLRAIIASYDGTDFETVMEVPYVTSPITHTRQVNDNWPTTGIGTFDDMAVVRLIYRFNRINSDSTALDTDWMHLSGLRVSCIRLDRNGAEIVAAGSYTNKYVLAHEALIDALARFAPEIDLPNARIDATSIYEHKQLVWPDGINIYQLINDHLLAFDPAYTWGVWGRQDNGLWEFEWRERDTDVRYELEADDGFERTGANLDKAYRVYYTGTSLRDLFRIGTAYDDTHPDAFDPNIPVRSKVITVDSKFDDTNFNDEGFNLAETTLGDSKLVASAATATVRRRVYDHKLGRHVHPWEIRSGYNARVAGVHAELDSMNDGSSDDSAVFRIVSKQYSTGSKEAKLELNSFTLDERRALTALVNRRRVLA